MAASTASLATELAQRFSDRNQLRDALRHQTISEGNAAVGDRLAAVAVVEPYEPGQVLIHQGGTDTDIFMILAGAVIVSPNGRDDTVRVAHNHVGEMATIDPTVRRSATVRASEPTVVARVREGDFSQIANDHPVVWRRLAMELAERLRRRASGVQIRKGTPRVFIASSFEALSTATQLQNELLSPDLEVKLWTDGMIFTPGSTNIEALEDELSRADFAVLLLSADDRVLSRWTWSKAPRDNLILELGLFIGAIGRHRAIMVYPRAARLKLPSDLLGVTPIKYLGSDMRSVAIELHRIAALLGSK
jgi:CRP/FNR family transcriptional regulator, cyclic AMP receptor protein